MAKQPISPVVAQRLPLYLQALERLKDEQRAYVSSAELAQRVGMKASQIRKDLSLFGEFGTQGRGYPVERLMHALRRILNVDRVWPVALVGVGNLGRALLRYQGFEPRGFRIAFAFDIDPVIVGTKIGDIWIQDIREMEDTLKGEGISIAILAVPAHAAQNVADRLVRAGIRAILNYTPTRLRLPVYVQVRDVDPVIYLQSMTYYLGHEEEI